MSQAAPERSIPRRRQIVAPAPRPRLRLVAQPRTRRRLPFVLVCVILVVAGLVGVLLLNITLSHNSYRIAALTREQTRLDERQQYLAEDLSYRDSPQNLAAAAKALGMVPDPHPLFLRLSDGKVLGSKDTAGMAPSAGTNIPGPAADARESSRPNLRAGQKQTPIGAAPGAAGTDSKASDPKKTPAPQKTPVPQKTPAPQKTLPDNRIEAPSQRTATGGDR